MIVMPLLLLLLLLQTQIYEILMQIYHSQNIKLKWNGERLIVTSQGILAKYLIIRYNRSFIIPHFISEQNIFKQTTTKQFRYRIYSNKIYIGYIVFFKIFSISSTRIVKNILKLLNKFVIVENNKLVTGTLKDLKKQIFLDHNNDKIQLFAGIQNFIRRKPCYLSRINNNIQISQTPSVLEITILQKGITLVLDGQIIKSKQIDYNYTASTPFEDVQLQYSLNGQGFISSQSVFPFQYKYSQQEINFKGQRLVVRNGIITSGMSQINLYYQNNLLINASQSNVKFLQCRQNGYAAIVGQYFLVYNKQQENWALSQTLQYFTIKEQDNKLIMINYYQSLGVASKQNFIVQRRVANINQSCIMYSNRLYFMNSQLFIDLSFNILPTGKRIIIYKVNDQYCMLKVDNKYIGCNENGTLYMTSQMFMYQYISQYIIENRNFQSNMLVLKKMQIAYNGNVQCKNLLTSQMKKLVLSDNIVYLDNGQVFIARGQGVISLSSSVYDQNYQLVNENGCIKFNIEILDRTYYNQYLCYISTMRGPKKYYLYQEGVFYKLYTIKRAMKFSYIGYQYFKLFKHIIVKKLTWQNQYIFTKLNTSAVFQNINKIRYSMLGQDAQIQQQNNNIVVKKSYSSNKCQFLIIPTSEYQIVIYLKDSRYGNLLKLASLAQNTYVYCKDVKQIYDIQYF